jgi:hypothetical protein
MTQLGRLLLLAGVALAAAGLVLLLGGRLGLGRWPGDLRFERGGVRVYFPIASALIVSLVVTVALNLVKALIRR